MSISRDKKIAWASFEASDVEQFKPLCEGRRGVIASQAVEVSQEGEVIFTPLGKQNYCYMAHSHPYFSTIIFPQLKGMLT